MIDVTGYRLNFRGYPVTLVSDGVAALSQETGLGLGSALGPVLFLATDTAGPDEPSGWMFTSELDGHEVWIERFGGIRDEDSHKGGQWSVYLPAER
jgi:hypothetical protein